jgi:ankyrin repeat protein
MIACDLGRLQNVEVLLEHFEKRASRGSEQQSDEEESEKFEVDYINFKDKSSRTALQYAAYQGHTKIVKVLIDAGAVIESKNSK